MFQGKNERIDISKASNSSADDMEDEVIRIESEKGEYKQYYEERRRIELAQKLKQEEDDLNFAKLIASQEDSTLVNTPATVIPAASQQGVAASHNSQVKTNKKTQLSIDIALAVQSSLRKQDGAPSSQSEGGVSTVSSACSGKENAVINLVNDDKWIQLKQQKAKISLQNNTNKTNHTKHTEDSSSKGQRNISEYLMPAAIDIIKTSDINRISSSSSNTTYAHSSGSSSSAHSSSKSSRTTWQCSRCTLLNPIHSKVCDACDYTNEELGDANTPSPLVLAKRPKLL